MSTAEQGRRPPSDAGGPPRATNAEHDEVRAACDQVKNSPTPPSGVDENGRPLPSEIEAYRERMKRFPEFLASLATITDDSDTEEKWVEFMRNIDSERREAGMRTLYDGMY